MRGQIYTHNISITQYLRPVKSQLSDSEAWRQPYQDVHRFEDLQDNVESNKNLPNQTDQDQIKLDNLLKLRIDLGSLFDDNYLRPKQYKFTIITTATGRSIQHNSQ